MRNREQEGKSSWLRGGWKPGPNAHSREGAGTARLFTQQHVAAPILLMAGLVVVGTEGAILPVRDNRHLLRVDAQIDQETLGGLGPFFAEHEVIIMGPALIAVPGDFEERLGILFEPSGIGRQRGDPVIV